MQWTMMQWKITIWSVIFFHCSQKYQLFRSVAKLKSVQDYGPPSLISNVEKFEMLSTFIKLSKLKVNQSLFHMKLIVCDTAMGILIIIISWVFLHLISSLRIIGANIVHQNIYNTDYYKYSKWKNESNAAKLISYSKNSL